MSNTNYLNSEWTLKEDPLHVFEVIDQTGLGHATPQGEGDAILVLKYKKGVMPKVFAPNVRVYTVTLRALPELFDRYKGISHQQGPKAEPTTTGTTPG